MELFICLVVATTLKVIKVYVFYAVCWEWTVTFGAKFG